MFIEVATTIVITISGITGIWSGPYVPAPEPTQVAVETVTKAEPAATPAPVTTTTEAATAPCLTVYVEWVDEYTAIVAGYDGPGGDDGFLFDFKGHVLNYQWQGGPMQSVELVAGQAAVTVCGS
jgi:hypothetical protein